MNTTQHKRKQSAVDEFIGQVKRQLKKTGMTMTQLAEASDVSREYIYRILSGEQNPSMEIAEKIAKPLGLTVQTVAKQ